MGDNQVNYMKLTIHRGAEEIGGNCIELATTNSRILLDYGTPLPKIGPNGEMCREDPAKAILDIPGLYTDSEMPISGLLISHTHADHYGMLFEKPLNPKIPVYMSEIMEEVISISSRMGLGHKELKANIRHFERDKEFKVGDFRITPILVDHSASEAFSFLIKAEGKTVLYTGDYREHGHKTELFNRYLKMDMGKIDCLITEGTMAGEEEGKTEKIVMGEISELIRKRSGTVYIMSSGQNVDLLCSLGGIAEQNGRYLVVDGYVALILERLRELAEKAGRKLHIPGLNKKYLKVVDNSTTQNVWKYMGDTAANRRIKNKVVSWDWINANLDLLIIPVRTHSQNWLDENIIRYDGSMFIYSIWEGYMEGAEFRKTIDYFKTRGMEPYPIHVSGHAYMSTIRKLVKKKKPDTIIPVHTLHPEIFKQEFGNKVQIMKNGDTREI